MGNGTRKSCSIFTDHRALNQFYSFSLVHGQHQFCRTINSQQRCDQNDNSCREHKIQLTYYQICWSLKYSRVMQWLAKRLFRQHQHHHWRVTLKFAQYSFFTWLSSQVFFLLISFSDEMESRSSSLLGSFIWRAFSWFKIESSFYALVFEKGAPVNVAGQELWGYRGLLMWESTLRSPFWVSAHHKIHRWCAF